MMSVMLNKKDYDLGIIGKKITCHRYYKLDVDEIMYTEDAFMVQP